MPRRFVLLDRDGTLIVDRHYLAAPNEVELLPGVALGLRKLAQMGLGLVIITNQSGVGRGFYCLDQVEQVHRHLMRVLESEQVHIDGVYFCPHSPGEGCHCRKPETGLVEQAAHELGFCAQQCFVVGDRASDIELGWRIGATTFLVTGGMHCGTPTRIVPRPDFVVDGVNDAANLIAGLTGSQVEV